MAAIVDKLLELPRELRSGFTWLVLATLIVGADAYGIARFDMSLIAALSKAEQFAQTRPDLGLALTEGFYALVAVVLFWFYVKPLAVWAWRQFVYMCRVHGPSWMCDDIVSGNYPRPSQGWQAVRFVRLRAIEQNNALLLNACDQRVSERKERDLTLGCVLAIISFSAIAFLTATPASGASLVMAALLWLDDVPLGLRFFVLLFALPLLPIVWAILADRGTEFDDHIQFAAPVDSDHSRRSTPS
jgi:hypothetical protein